MASPVDYLYCVVPASLSLGGSVLGIDETPLRAILDGDIAALVSTLDGETYRPEAIEQCVTDLTWLRPRAVAHDRVVTWASDRGAVVPMPMWTLFSDDAGVTARLHERRAELEAMLRTVRDAREYTVRVFIDPTEMATSLSRLSPRLAALERDVAAATPGARYLLQRKLEETRTAERRAVARRVAEESYDVLARYATDAVHDPLPQEGKRGDGQGGEGGVVSGSAVLNASFLIATPRYDDFRRALTALLERYEPAGFRFDFTGPWPPYHFVRAR